MIWLRKRLDDQIIYGEQSSGDYIRKEMLSFSVYKQSIEESVLDDNLENDIKWKSFQLVDVYLRCMIVYKWIVIPTIKGKGAFFKAFANPKKLIEYVSIDCLIPSEKILSLPQNIQGNFQNDFNEVINDYVKEYKDMGDFISPITTEKIKEKFKLLNYEKDLDFGKIIKCKRIK